MSSRVIGNYRILDYIGGGGFGSVFKAEDSSAPGRIVAIKELHKKHTRSAVIKQRFFQEAVAMARLDHPNLPRLFTFGEDNGSYYLVMEFLSGKLLSEILAERGALSAEQATAIIAQVLEAVSYAHRNGIIHRDLKPDNIMLMNEDGALKVKVLDFGIARMVGGENLTLAGEGFGTPAYMSPERMAAGLNLDHRTDIYSAGIILFEMLTGKAPFESNATDPAIYWSEMRSFHESAELPPLAPLGVPQELERVARKAAAKRVEDRYATVEDMLADLAGLSVACAVDALKPRSARLSLATAPPGAEVYVDNLLRGLSDEASGKLLIEGLAPGLHSVRVLKAGYSEYSISVSLEEGSHANLQVALAARATIAMPSVEGTAPVDFKTQRLDGGDDVKTAMLKVESLPAGSTVFVGTQAVALADEDGRATIRLNPGVHEIRITDPNGATSRSHVTISDQDTGSLKTITIPLAPAASTDPQPATPAAAPVQAASTTKKHLAVGAAVMLLVALAAAAYFVLRGPSRGSAQVDAAPAQSLAEQPSAETPSHATQAESSASEEALRKVEEDKKRVEAELKATEREKKEAEARLAAIEQSKTQPEAQAAPSDPAHAAHEQAQSQPAASAAAPQAEAGRACLFVRIIGPNGSPAGRVRVAAIEQPGSSQERIYGGPTGPNGGWKTCGLTAGHRVRIEALGPGRAVLASRQLMLVAGGNVVELRIERLPEAGQPNRERPRMKRPFFNRP